MEKILEKLVQRFNEMATENLNAGELYLVGTPIGNLNDISPRALLVLAKADIIAAEDTRHTAKLLSAFAIHNQLLSYHEHNQQKMASKIVELLLAGKTVALVTDAGMPAISDPGQVVCALCHEHGIKVNVVPGPTAVASAIAASGIVEKDFYFGGFVASGGRERNIDFTDLFQHDEPVVIYESPHRIKKTLDDLLNHGLGDCRICLVRELTKIHEDIFLTTVEEAKNELANNPERCKGEFVLIIDKPKSFVGGNGDDAEILEQDVSVIKEKIREWLKMQPPSDSGLKKISRQLAKKFNLSAKEVYKLLVEIKSEDMV